MLSRLVRLAILQLIRLFYPRIEVRGREHLPQRGPVIFVLNHPNGLLDALVLIVGVGRHVSFLAKSTFFANPVGRVCMEAFGALPVFRPRDEGREGGPKGDRADRNEETFARCRALLRRGEPLALFPEGTTHSNTVMLPLRTGAARIALSAEAEAGWRLGLQVVPVGLWYQNKAQFRSSALVVIGEPFDLASYGETYATDQHEAVRALTEEIDKRLDMVVLQAENAELLNGIPLIAAWTAPHGPPPTLQQQHARATNLLVAYERLRTTNPARLELVAAQARRYARVLRTLGIDDPWELELSGVRRGRILWFVFLLVVGFVPAVAGFALSYGPYRLAAPLTPLLLGRYEETTSTGKLIIGSVLVALGFVLAALVAGVLFGPLWAALLLVAAPPLAYIALRWGEIWAELREVVAYNWLMLRHRALAQQLIARRQALAAQVMQAMQEAESATLDTAES
jgi:1-acyl-sn-glycerol-3-phosphate acyltransferase